jgi:hypothetical protein
MEHKGNIADLLVRTIEESMHIPLNRPAKENTR